MTNLGEPQSLAARARQVYEGGDLSAAVDAFAQAAEAYGAQGDEMMKAEMKNNQCVVLLRLGRAADALQVNEGSAQVFASAGDHRRQGMAHGNRAAALEALKRRGEALVEYQNAAAALEKAGEDQMRLQVMQLLATLHLRRWKFIDAVIALQSGLAGVKEPTAKQRLMKKLLFMRL